MSELLTYQARLLAIARAAVPGLSLADGPTPTDGIPDDRLPLAWVGALAKRSRPGDLGSEDRVLEGALVVVSNVSLEDARAKGDAIEAAIVADRTLVGIVSTTFVEAEAESVGNRHVAILAVQSTVRDGSSAAAGGPLVRYEVRAQARLRAALTGGTTAAAYRTALAAAVAALLTGTRFSSDLENPPLEAVPASSTRFQLATLAAEIALGSNVTGLRVSIALRVFHRGAAGELERAYTEGAMAVETATLLGREFWKAGFADVDVDADELPEITFPGDVARV